jgi:hypothetical protein
VADNRKLWPDFTRIGVGLEQIEDGLLVILTQAGENAVILLRFWIFRN